MRIAILGTGRMGRALGARLLQQRQQVAVWNRTPGRAAEVLAAGAAECPDIAAAVRSAEVVVTVLAADDAVRAVVLEEGGVLEHLDGQVLVDASTVSPALSDELAKRCRSFVAMPVAGSPDAVRAGAAAYLVGGPAATVERITPLLDALSQRRHVYRSAALAGVAKLTGNMLLLAGLVGLVEAVQVARDGGLSDEQLHDLLAEHAMLAPGVRNRLPAVLAGGAEAWWTNRLGTKDIGLALDVAAAAGDRLPVAVAVRERYAAAIDRGLGDDDIATVAKLYAL